MNQPPQKHLDNLHSDDAELRYASFLQILQLTNQQVDWAYEVWDDLLLQLRHKNNHQRAIAAQLLSNLAKSDTANRMLKDINQLFAVTKDERFVTARHSLQCLWKIALVNKDLQKKVVDFLSTRFKECATEKNGTLIRYDIIEVIRKIYNQVKDEKIKEKALALIQTEEDVKYRKKYAGLWKDVIKAEKK
jgi:hypothetical protein